MWRKCKWKWKGGKGASGATPTSSGHVKWIGMCRGKSLKLIGLCPPQMLVVSPPRLISAQLSRVRQQSISVVLKQSHSWPMTLMALKLHFICTTTPGSITVPLPHHHTKPLTVMETSGKQQQWDTNLSQNNCIRLFMGLCIYKILRYSSTWACPVACIIY